MSDHTALTVFEGSTDFNQALTLFLNQPWSMEMEQTIAMRAGPAQTYDSQSAQYHMQQVWGMYAGAFHNNVSDVFIQSFNALANWPSPEHQQSHQGLSWDPTF